MSALRKAIQYLGFDVSEHEDYDYAEDELAPVTNLHDVSEAREQAARKSSAHTGSVRTAHHAPRPVQPSDLRRIQTIKPRSYNDARLIGEAFREGVPVIMNLTEMSDADAKRLVDFSAGLSFGLHGSIERVTTSVFLLSPAHVEIGLDDEQHQAQQSFYDQA
ncbi:cell division protein SepF [Demequina capsici]|uniref:Cell division protein SepF n=1 Tax=Demequina capsici TaxID=3075620 RepID=A0AA96F5V1_9MICO|nr:MULTISPECIES: cell division protein SepF [unclassified Demequina]WNM23342.1 cell division protein SepF [Demequina sp. OYTSA14]WNM26219.1 cell division protein SepF [Demequina sp. PMTSA13]